MNNRDFKTLFDSIATNYGFVRDYGGWFFESAEVNVVLDLQKSNHKNIFYLNIKFFVHGLFGKVYSRDKHLVNSEIGDVFTRPPSGFEAFFDLDSNVTTATRIVECTRLFDEYIHPLVQSCSTRRKLLDLDKQGRLHMLPAVRQELKGTV